MRRRSSSGSPNRPPNGSSEDIWASLVAGGSRPRAPADSWLRRLLTGPVLTPSGDDLLEAAHPEDEDERGEADPERERSDGDLLAHRVRGHGRAPRGAAEDLHQERLLHARALWRERHGGGHGVHAEHEQHVLHRSADVEG